MTRSIVSMQHDIRDLMIEAAKVYERDPAGPGAQDILVATEYLRQAKSRMNSAALAQGEVI